MAKVNYRTLDDNFDASSRIREEFFSAAAEVITAEAEIKQMESLLEQTDRPDEQSAYGSSLEALRNDLERARRRIDALKKTGVEPPEDMDARVREFLMGNLRSYEQQHASAAPYIKYLKDAGADDRADSEERRQVSLVAMIDFYHARLDELDGISEGDESPDSEQVLAVATKGK